MKAEEYYNTDGVEPLRKLCWKADMLLPDAIIECLTFLEID